MSAALELDDYRSILARSQKDPEFFVREVLGNSPWQKQVEIMESVRDKRVTAVPSCHASGKSWIAGQIVVWFTYSFPGAKVVTTAPTDRQIRGILWSEIHAARRHAPFPLGGEPTVQRLEIEEDWYATGFTAPDWDPNRFQGFHAPHILVVVDEAAGVTGAIADQIDSLLSGGHARKLEIGNPVQANTPFQHSCESRFVNVLPISAFDTPNFTEFGVTEKDMVSGAWEKKIKDKDMPMPDLISPQWVAERLEIWGVKSNAWRSRVLGQFPESVEGAYYGELMKEAEKKSRIAAEPHDPQHPVITSWDIGIRDATAIWFAQWAGSELRLIDYYENVGKGLPHYVEVLQQRGYKYCDHIAPFDMGNQVWVAGKTRAQIATQLGLNFRILPKMKGVKQGTERAEGIDAVRRLIPKCRFDADKCQDGIDALKNYKRALNTRTGEFRDEPDHDWASHGADAFRYLALGLVEKRRVSRPKPNTRWVT